MWTRQLFRLPPKLPVHVVKSYVISSPIGTHTRPATCAEVECSGYTQGWATVVDERTELGQKQAYYMRHDSGRSFTEHRTEDGWTAFEFSAGQRCFQSDAHRVSLERPALFIVRGGDWRGNPLGDHRLHARPEHWVEDFALHQQSIKDRVERG